jgi:nucleoside-diphosphate-sugar epimerase
MSATSWATGSPRDFDELVGQLQGSSVVVNAAGSAAPTSGPTMELWGANAVLPSVIALAAAAAGCELLVHVSSAAVQGSQPCLDEQPFVSGHSPYAIAKGGGEVGLGALGALATFVYRPPSVLGADRPITTRLAAALRSPWLPLPAGRDPHLPVALVDNVGAAIGFLTDAPLPDSLRIIAHPWEHQTVRSLAAAFGRTAPFRSVPSSVAKVAELGLRAGMRAGGGLAGRLRRIELLWCGQDQRSSLPGMGFECPEGISSYTRLGAEVRGSAG